jgi:hypothetical protein
MYKSFRPGKVWYDTEGKKIQAHGGSIIFSDNIFYWYGENKAGITGKGTGERCKNWHNGVRLYSSNDLYNWTDEGIIMFEKEDKNNPFFSTNIMDRPHIIFNEKTKQYVLWAKTSLSGFDNAFFSVCVSKSIKGPFVLINEVKQDNLSAGDFDLIIDNDIAYIIYEKPHTEIICQELNDSFTDLTDKYSSHLHYKCPPYIREAPAFFSRKNKKYLLTSGTTGYFPNPTMTIEIEDWHGEWKNKGVTCVNDKNNNSFHAQFSSVFKHPFIDDLYIALGDRWLIDLVPDMPNIEKAFFGMFDKDAEKILSYEELQLLSEENTSEADYVWLPIQFREDGTPYIIWLTNWNIHDFKNK